MTSTVPSPSRAIGARDRYKRAVRRHRNNRAKIREAWLEYLADHWDGHRDLRVFRGIRKGARDAGGKLAVEYLRGNKTAKEFFDEIQVVCFERYVRALNRHEITQIDMSTSAYRRMSRNIAFEVLQVFEGVDVNDQTQFCTAAAKVWHRFIQVLHAGNNLPSVQRMIGVNGWGSNDEKAVLDDGNFRTPLTPAQRAAWEAIVA